MLRFKKLLHDKKLMSGIYAVTLVTALLILALVVKGPEESGKRRIQIHRDGSRDPHLAAGEDDHRGPCHR